MRQTSSLWFLFLLFLLSCHISFTSEWAPMLSFRLMQMIPLCACVCVRVRVCQCAKVQCDVIPCVLVHWTALYYWAHNLHIIYMSSVWHRAIMEKKKKEPSVHICVYERAFLPLSEWMTIQINIKMIVEKQTSRGDAFSLRGFVKVRNLFYGCVS